MSRPVSFFGLARRSFWLLFGAIWLTAGAGLLFGGVLFALEERTYAEDGVTAIGMVLTKDIDRADSESSTEYRVRYRFPTEAGETVEGSDDVSVETWESLAERGPIEITYLRDRPSSNRLAGESQAFGAAIFLLTGAGFGGLGAVLVGRSLRSVLRARRLLRQGRPADATVTIVEPTSVSVNRRQQFRVRYTYRDAAGQTHDGDSGYLDWEEASRWSAGDVGQVRYDPGRPGDSLWLGAPMAPPQPSSDAIS